MEEWRYLEAYVRAGGELGAPAAPDFIDDAFLWEEEPPGIEGPRCRSLNPTTRDRCDLRTGHEQDIWSPHVSHWAGGDLTWLSKKQEAAQALYHAKRWP